MAGKKRSKGALAPRGDFAGMAAIRIWAMELETQMIERYIGNAPTLTDIRKIVSEAMRQLKEIKPQAMSDCGDWFHKDTCECIPPAS